MWLWISSINDLVCLIKINNKCNPIFPLTTIVVSPSFLSFSISTIKMHKLLFHGNLSRRNIRISSNNHMPHPEVLMMSILSRNLANYPSTYLSSVKKELKKYKYQCFRKLLRSFMTNMRNFLLRGVGGMSKIKHSKLICNSICSWNFGEWVQVGNFKAVCQNFFWVSFIHWITTKHATTK